MKLEPDTGRSLNAITRRLVRLRIWWSERFRISEQQAVVFWAALVGIAGAWIAIGFKEATDALHWLLTGSHEGFVASFTAMPGWRRVLVPTAGGLMAGLTLYLGSRLKGQGNSTDYMEAVVVGNGNLPVRASLMKSISAWFSGASGGSIGREGPLVQLSSLAASITGRWLNFPVPRRRQLVACGAAAGLASAYNAPIAGAFFVSEIVLGSVALESLGPLVISAIVAALATRSYYGPEALYSAPLFTMQGNRELIPYLLLGVACGAAAALFLGFLKTSENAFTKLNLPAWARLSCGGLIVGLLALFHPEVAGNGRSLVFGVLHHPGTWQVLLAVLAFKLVATGATFGSGAVGGVFTPTLFTGAAFGYLFGAGCSFLLPSWGLEPGAFGLVGMGAFLAASTGAPVMAIIMLFELTLNYQILIPVTLASIAGHYVCRSLTKRSLYAEALDRKGAAVMARHLATLQLRDLMRPDKVAIASSASFGAVARQFLQSRHEFLHVEEDGRFAGAIALQDIKPYIDQQELERLLIAKDLIREKHPRLHPGYSMAEALEIFANTDLERLPVTDEKERLLGVVAQNDVMLFLAGKHTKESPAETATAP